MRLPLVLLAVLPLAGCTGADGGFGFARDTLPADPYYKEYRELLAGEHHKDFAVPVEAHARAVTVQVTLESRTQGLPLPDAAPATLRVALLAPDGSVLDEAALDAQTTRANLTALDLAPAQYLARVDGFGASQPVDGKDYGAGYVLAVEVIYAQ